MGGGVISITAHTPGPAGEILTHLDALAFASSWRSIRRRSARSDRAADLSIGRCFFGIQVRDDSWSRLADPETGSGEIAPPARRIENPPLVPITSIVGIENRPESTRKPALARMPRTARFEPPHILLPGECPGPVAAGYLRDESDRRRRADECRLADRRALRNAGDRRRRPPAAETGRIFATAIAAPGSQGAPHRGLWRMRRGFPRSKPLGALSVPLGRTGSGDRADLSRAAGSFAGKYPGSFARGCRSPDKFAERHPFSVNSWECKHARRDMYMEYGESLQMFAHRVYVCDRQLNPPSGPVCCWPTPFT